MSHQLKVVVALLALFLASCDLVPARQHHRINVEPLVREQQLEKPTRSNLQHSEDRPSAAQPKAHLVTPSRNSIDGVKSPFDNEPDVHAPIVSSHQEAYMEYEKMQLMLKRLRDHPPAWVLSGRRRWQAEHEAHPDRKKLSPQQLFDKMVPHIIRGNSRHYGTQERFKQIYLTE